MKILFDKEGAQILADEKQEGQRLAGLFDTIKAAGWTCDIAGPVENKLNDVNVLVLTNRVAKGYTPNQITSIINFVRQGGGLWCMANHAAFNAGSAKSQGNNHVRHDSAISTTFFTDFQAAAYQSTTKTTVPCNGMLPSVSVVLEEDNLTDHLILRGDANWPLAPGSFSTAIQQVVTRSFCGVYPNSFTTTIARLQGLDDVINTQDDMQVRDNVVWAVAIDDVQVTLNGRVVICGDAGWLGDTTSCSPGKGQFQEGNNAQFALNTLAWLGQLS